MSKRSTFIALCVLAGGLLLAGLASANGRSAASTIRLRRESFDPLSSAPTDAAQASAPARLLLVQFEAAPGPGERAALERAGLHPLLYIPDNAFLVRAAQPVAPAAIALPGLRWAGPFPAKDRISAELDSTLSTAAANPLDLRLLAPPDADLAALEQALRGLGGALRDRSISATGASLRVSLPASALGAVIQSDDVLWAEPFRARQISNDRAGGVLGIPAARAQYGLNGSGQIVAVTDTGLDVQSSLSADFSGRLVAGFSPSAMFSGCSGTVWNDHNGHGTHVSGTVMGSGALSPAGPSMAGMAPQARLVIEAVSSGGRSLDCLPFDTSYLSKAYDAGARVQNASWGGATGSGGSCLFGCYDDFARDVDTFLWDHKEHLFVVAAGNSGGDDDDNGVIDPDSIGSPAIAKNVLAVGATENNRPPSGGGCTGSTPANVCWGDYLYGPPFETDFISNNIDGMAAFSSRGPADDGRIKPEIAAPGVNIISARSHDELASYGGDELYGNDYAYKSGTSMATPMISGLAALVRQWLTEQRHLDAPTAALVKALLIDGATNITPGQYGTGLYREIPAAWPNSVEGWGRASITDTIGLGSDDRVWLHEGAGVQTGDTVSYTLDISDGAPLRFTLAWTDYPGNPAVDKQLVNDLDLEVQAPDSSITLGNASADLRADCREDGYDRCNNVESVDLAEPTSGRYIVRVRAHVVSPLGGPQPFALVGRALHIADVNAPPAPTLQPIANGGAPALALTWNSVGAATYYQVQQSASGSFATIQATAFSADANLTLVENVGTYYFRVRSCNASGCGAYGNIQAATVATPPLKLFLPLTAR